MPVTFSNPNPAIPQDQNGVAALSVYDPVTHGLVVLHATNIRKDDNNNVLYGDLSTDSNSATISANTAATASVLGTTGDSAATDSTSSWSLNSLIRYVVNLLKQNKYDSSGNLQTTATNPTYESTSGGPTITNGTPSGLSLDQRRNAQGKKYAQGTITATAANDTALVFSSAPLTLPTNAPIILSGGANPQEKVYAVATFAPGPGVTTVNLQNAVQYAGHTTATWDVTGVNGPQGAMTATGLATTQIVIHDPNSTNPLAYYEAMAATQDGAAATNVPLFAAGYYNGASVDRVQAAKPLPTLLASQANYVALTSPPAQTTASTDTVFTFSSAVNTVILQNNSGANLNYAFDAVSSPGTLLLATGQTLVYSKKVTAVHLYTSAAQNVNGGSAGNIVLLGEL